MGPVFKKQDRIVLTGDAYRALQQEVFTLDDWRCRICLRRKPLEMHHVRPRSLGRRDAVDNCISLCTRCHSYVTDKFCCLEWDDVNQRTVIVTWRDNKSRI